MNVLSVKVLKDNGCNINVVSREFMRKVRTRKIFKIRQENVTVEQSKKGTNKETLEDILSGPLTLGDPTYTCNWIAAN